MAREPSWLRERAASPPLRLSTVPRVQPELDLGPLTVQTFGICLAFAFLGSGAVLARRLIELDKPVDWAYEMVFAAAIGGLVGSRVDYLTRTGARSQAICWATSSPARAWSGSAGWSVVRWVWCCGPAGGGF